MFDDYDQGFSLPEPTAEERREAAEHKASHDDYVDGMLASILDDTVEVPADPSARTVISKATEMVAPDPADDDIIIEKPAWQSRYDKAFERCRKLQGELRALQAKPDRTAKETTRLAVVKELVKTAEANLEKQRKRGLEDNYRRWESHDEWRSTGGRETYNESRRTRDKPNERLDHLTDREKADRKKDQSFAANFRSRHTKAGKTKEWIEAALITRLEKRRVEREQERAEAEEITRQEAEMKAAHPTFGMMSP